MTTHSKEKQFDINEMTEEELRTTCLICGKTFELLGTHVFQTHGITAREYKEEFELPYNLPLTSNRISKIKSEKFDREKSLKNILNNKKTQFKKGRTGQRRISQLERTRFLKRIKKVNKEMKYEKCPVCNRYYKHLPSHLQTKHGLIRIKDIKQNE